MNQTSPRAEIPPAVQAITVPPQPSTLTFPAPSGKNRPGNPALRPSRSMTMPARGLPSNELTVRALPYFYYYGFRYAG